MERLAQILIFLPVLLISVVLHEVAHGWMALKQGDDTALRAGRLTLNPVPHIDPVGSILVPLVLLLLPGGLLFGWARPVPVDPRRYRDYRKGDILVSLAGIGMNIVLAAAFTMLMALAVWTGRRVPSLLGPAEVVLQMGTLGVVLNLILAFFNLIPLPPLDGSRVLFHLLPPSLRGRYQEMGRYGLGIMILVVFLVPGVISALLWPAFALSRLAFALVGWLA